MSVLSVLALFSVAVVQGGSVHYNETVYGMIRDGQLFRVVCELNTVENPQFSIRITGYSENYTALFIVSFNKGASSTSYFLTLQAGKSARPLPLPAYQVLVDDDKFPPVPVVPIVMGYGKAIFTSHTAGQGSYVNSSTQAIDLEMINVLASGASLVSCTCVETGKTWLTL